MKRDPKDLVRYSAAERLNHWVVGMAFILLALSGLAFFHPLFFPLSGLFGGGTWARILHPFIGAVMLLSFIVMLFRFWKSNLMTPTDWTWLRRMREMVNGDDHNMPEAGKYNGGQKLLFWLVVVCMALLAVSGIVIWRAYFSAYFPLVLVRLAAVVHAASAVVMIILIIVHAYAAIWTKGTIRAMLYGTVSRARAKQHHARWFKDMTGEGK
jgi:formate dehydrogenase subunit gamma